MDSGLSECGQTDSGSKDTAQGNAAYRNAAKRNEIPQMFYDALSFGSLITAYMYIIWQCMYSLCISQVVMYLM